MLYFCKTQKVTLGRRKRSLSLKSKQIKATQESSSKPKPDFDISYYCLVELGK